VSLVLPAGYAVAKSALPTSTPTIGAVCHESSLPAAAGLSGLLQNLALTGLDKLACSQGITREQLVLRMVGAG
jgi:hypothetical protein